jgi:putative sigma-54 modulation protein
MKLDLTGDGVEITPAIREYVEKKAQKLEKFFEEDTIAHVTYSSKKGVSDLDIRIEEKGVTYMAEEENRDLYAGIDLAIDKILGQIRKQKTKILSSRN